MFAAEKRHELPKGTAKRWAEHTPNIKKLPEHVKHKKNKKKTKMNKAADFGTLLGKMAADGPLPPGRQVGQPIPNVGGAGRQIEQMLQGLPGGGRMSPQQPQLQMGFAVPPSPPAGASTAGGNRLPPQQGNPTANIRPMLMETNNRPDGRLGAMPFPATGRGDGGDPHNAGRVVGDTGPGANRPGPPLGMPVSGVVGSGQRTGSPPIGAAQAKGIGGTTSAPGQVKPVPSFGNAR